jgi:hypothetical protein
MVVQVTVQVTTVVLAVVQVAAPVLLVLLEQLEPQVQLVLKAPQVIQEPKALKVMLSQVIHTSITSTTPMYRAQLLKRNK